VQGGCLPYMYQRSCCDGSSLDPADGLCAARRAIRRSSRDTSYEPRSIWARKNTYTHSYRFLCELAWLHAGRGVWIRGPASEEEKKSFGVLGRCCCSGWFLQAEHPSIPSHPIPRPRPRQFDQIHLDFPQSRISHWLKLPPTRALRQVRNTYLVFPPPRPLAPTILTKSAVLILFSSDGCPGNTS
jgi:hypothetical protein